MTTPVVHRASNRFGLRMASRTGPRSEDAQPNESVNRRQRQPPTVNSAAHSRRSWWARCGQNKPPSSQQSIPRERTGHSRRALPSISVKHAVPYARPQSLATAGGTRCPNTAHSHIDTGSRQLRQGHSVSTPEMSTSEPSASKRQRQLECPSIEIKHEIPTASIFAPSVSPVSSETLVDEQKVKVERDFSPELHAQPQLSTTGSKRYAPLPLECRRSHPNHVAARSAWARKEQEALRRLGLRVVRSFIREDGMVIDWEAIGSEPTDIAAVIERALLINDAATRDPPVSSAKRAISPRISASQSSKWDQLDGGKDVPFAVEIPQALVSLEGFTHSVGGPGVDASPICDMDIRNQSQTPPTHMDIGDDAVHTPTPIAFAWEDLRGTLPPFSPFPCHPRPSLCHQVASDDLLHPSTPSSEMRTRASSSQSSRLLHGRSTSPRHFPSPPPSQPALDTLHNILKLKRQINRSSRSVGPSAASPSPSCSLRRLYPAPKEPPAQTPLKRPAESSAADVVAAALNESARLSQEGSLASSTPLRPYKRHRPLTATLLRGNTKDTVPGHRERGDDSLSPKRPPSPSLAAALGLTGSVLGSPLTDLTSSVSGDELDFSYPPSPKRRCRDVHSHRTSAKEPTEQPPRPMELMEPAKPEAASLSSPKLPSPEEKAAMQSAALQFLQRYGQTFDTDQRALAEAYAPHATFSCPSRGLRTQGREGILGALAQLGHGVGLCSERNVAYDVFSVPGIGVLLVVLGTMIGAQADGNRNVGYTMSFVLQQSGDHEDRRGTGHWPLVAAMHQIILREDS